MRVCLFSGDLMFHKKSKPGYTKRNKIFHNGNLGIIVNSQSGHCYSKNNYIQDKIKKVYFLCFYLYVVAWSLTPSTHSFRNYAQYMGSINHGTHKLSKNTDPWYFCSFTHESHSVRMYARHLYRTNKTSPIGRLEKKVKTRIYKKKSDF